MNNLSFISNNVKEIQAILKWIKLFEYLKNYVTSNGFFLFKKYAIPLKMKKYGVKNLKVSFLSW